MIVFLLTFIEWRDIWVSISILVIIVLPIASYFLVKEIKLDTREDSNKEAIIKEIKQWKRTEVLKDYRFYIICMTMLAMPWIATGTFVYQSFITSSKGWGPYVIAQSFMGITNGLANVLGSSTWAEIYGVKHIGSIKALTTALMVFATAFGTALFGILIDINFSIEQIAVVSGAYILTSIILLYSVRSNLNPQYL